jgi:hypothetical protein
VPAGQHNRTLQIDSLDVCLSAAMNRFSQSGYFPEAELLRLPLFNAEMAAFHERRFRDAFDLFEGQPGQKAVMFDVWTRQRNFIAYYPRTLEWRVPVVSPHMTPEYANFFLSLSERHLDNRRAIELMFREHYPEVADIASNSNGYSAMAGLIEKAMVRAARALVRLRCGWIIPKAYKNTPLSLDRPAMLLTGRDSYHPLLDMPAPQRDWFDRLFPRGEVEALLDGAARGGEAEYNRLAMLQPVAYGLGLIAEHSRAAHCNSAEAEV